MTDILLDEYTHDVVYINGDTPITAEDKTNVAQKLKIKLQTFKSEWF